MALVECSECGKNVSDKASNCPYCGAPVLELRTSYNSENDYQEENLFSSNFIWGGIAGLAIFLGIVFLIVSQNNHKINPNAWKTMDNSIGAYIVMKDFVKERLKSPSTAIFPNDSYKNHVKILLNRTYEITSYVDSQNSFGATTRTFFSGRVRQDEENRWGLISLEFE